MSGLSITIVSPSLSGAGGWIRTIEPFGSHLQCGAFDHFATPACSFTLNNSAYYAPEQDTLASLENMNKINGLEIELDSVFAGGYTGPITILVDEEIDVELLFT